LLEIADYVDIFSLTEAEVIDKEGNVDFYPLARMD
jgi:hypothetical protein